MNYRAINDALKERILRLCSELMPAGKQHGAEYRDAKSTAGGTIGDSLYVRIAGARAGAWRHYGGKGDRYDFATGGPLDLIAYCKSLTLREAAAWAETWLGKVDTTPAPTVPVVSPAPARELTPDEKRIRNRERARKIWNAGRSVEGSLGERYLRSRGLARLRYPSTLRYVPNLFHDFMRVEMPGLVWLTSPVMAREPGAPDPTFGIWREYLKADGTGKADCGDHPARLGLGDAMARAIFITRPIDGVLRRVALSEGTQTAMDAAARWPSWTHLSGMAGGNLAAIVMALPATVEEVLHVVDHDFEHERNGRKWRPGDQFAEAVATACRRRAFRHISIKPAIEGCDINDLTMRGLG